MSIMISTVHLKIYMPIINLVVKSTDLPQNLRIIRLQLKSPLPLPLQFPVDNNLQLPL